MNWTINYKQVSACTKSEIVEHLFYDKRLRGIIRNVMKNQEDLWDDMLQESMLWIMEKMDFDKLVSLVASGEFRYYYTRMVTLQFNSPNSRFYNVYVKPKKNEIHCKVDSKVRNQYEDTIDKDFELHTIELRAEHINSLEWYKRKVWELYHQPGMTFQKLSNETKIPVNSLFNTINEIKKEIREKITYLL